MPPRAYKDSFKDFYASQNTCLSFKWRKSKQSEEKLSAHKKKHSMTHFFQKCKKENVAFPLVNAMFRNSLKQLVQVEMSNFA